MVVAELVQEDHFVLHHEFCYNQLRDGHIEKLGPGTKSKVRRRSLGPKHFTKFGLHTHHTHTHTPHTTTHKLLGHFRGT